MHDDGDPRRAIVAAFHGSSRLRRSDIFADDKLMPITAVEDASTAAPGWVGQTWIGGTLLVGINPGGGGDNYRRNPSDDELYNCARAFREAKSEETQSKAFESLSTKWIQIQQTHSIWRIIEPILAATSESVDETAFMNILPFRTRMDALPPRAILRAAWEKAARPQISALKPKRVIALGKKAWVVITQFEMPTPADVILFKRGIGDSYIPVESLEVLTRLKANRIAKEA